MSDDEKLRAAFKVAYLNKEHRFQPDMRRYGDVGEYKDASLESEFMTFCDGVKFGLLAQSSDGAITNKGGLSRANMAEFMNIEEERKAFEAWYQTTPSVLGVRNRFERDKHYPEKYYFIGTAKSFAGWLAAKEHAEEMAKPAVVVGENMGGRIGIWLAKGSAQITEFGNKDLAVKWAKDNGYRVVDE